MSDGALKVFALAEEAMPERSCAASACCCKVAVTGREPFVTSAELRVLLDELKRQGRRVPPPRDDGGCPLLVDDRCSVYAARPLGCRTFFCSEAGGPATARQMREALHLLNTLDERNGKKGGRPLTRALEDALRGGS